MATKSPLLFFRRKLPVAPLPDGERSMLIGSKEKENKAD
jgi:hypothetical protein